jgi:hypothetical protein
VFYFLRFMNPESTGEVDDASFELIGEVYVMAIWTRHWNWKIKVYGR